MYIPWVLETSNFRNLRTLSTCLVNTSVNFLYAARQVPIFPSDKYFHIRNFYQMELFADVRCLWKNSQIHNKAPVSESLFNKVTGLYPANLLKQKTELQVFSDELCKIFINAFLWKTSWRILLWTNILPIK